MRTDLLCPEVRDSDSSIFKGLDRSLNGEKKGAVKPRVPLHPEVRKRGGGDQVMEGGSASLPGPSRVGPRLPHGDPNLGGPGLFVDLNETGSPQCSAK